MHWLLPSGYLPFFDLGLVHPHHLWKSPLVVLEGGWLVNIFTFTVFCIEMPVRKSVQDAAFCRI